MPSWIRETDDGVELDLHVQPGASKTEWSGEYTPARFKVRIQSRPDDGAANRDLCEFARVTMGVKGSQVSLVRGRASREKTVRIEGVDAERILEMLQFKRKDVASPGLQLQSATDAAAGDVQEPCDHAHDDHHEHQDLGTPIRV